MNERFEVSTAGLRELHAARPPWTLIKELVQNAWDEAPDSTFCEVLIQPSTPRRGLTTVIVNDDGTGFSGISHAYTLMAPNAKRGDPGKRGRFNLGEKEVVSLAHSAEIETVGQTVTFPATGGRTVTRNRRQSGTRVTVVMPWTREEAVPLRRMLRRFRPPSDCRLVVDGVEVAREEPLAVHEAVMPTVLQSGPGEPMRASRRRAELMIHDPQEGETGWLFELGIPVQPIDLPYDVDVSQKIPMPPNRDTVGAAYLQDLCAEVLNAMHPFLGPGRMSDPWVRTALEDDRVADEAVKRVAEGRYGEKAVMWSRDADANMKAAEEGYQVIHPRSMSPAERQRMRQVAGISSSHDVFGREIDLFAPVIVSAEWSQAQRDFAAWVVGLAAQVDLFATVEFVEDRTSGYVATCRANTDTPTVRFNTVHLSDRWFAGRGADQMKLVIHELAHAYAWTPMEHGPKWGEACAAVGGRLWAAGFAAGTG